MNIKSLQVRLTRDRFENPLAIVTNMPGEGMEASPEQLRQLAAAFAQAAADCEARETRGKRFVEEHTEYQLERGDGVSSQVQDHLFAVDAGRQVVEGKPVWPNMVRVSLPKEQALEVAVEILRRLQNLRFGEETLPDVTLVGRLTLLPND